MSYRTIVEENPKNIAVIDVFSKLIQNRIIFIDDVIDSDLANGVIAQMLYLDSLVSEDDSYEKKLINVYINTPGGSVYDGLAIYDTSKLLKSPIKTVCMGCTASMGAILLLMGKERHGLKHSRVMEHQPIGGVSGQASDIRITSKEIDKLETELYQIISDVTGKDIEQVRKDCDRDYWMTSEEALEYGFLTKIL